MQQSQSNIRLPNLIFFSLFWGHRDHENLENTFSTIRPVRPMNSQISLRISFCCLHELLWPLSFKRLSSEYMHFLIKANICFFHRYSCIFHRYSGISVVFWYFGKSCDRDPGLCWLHMLHVYIYMKWLPCILFSRKASDTAFFPDWRPGGRGLNPRRSRQHSFVEIDHEIHVFSTVILSLLLVQEGHLSVSGERMCTILVNRLED